MKFDEKGKPDFLDQKDRAAYRLLLSSMKQKGISKFKMTISIIDSKNLTEKQIKLYFKNIDYYVNQDIDFSVQEKCLNELFDIKENG